MARGNTQSVLAEAINGYIRGMQMKRGMDAQDSEEQWRNEQRTNARTDRAREDALRTDLTTASAPVQVEQGAGGVTKPETADNRDVGQPGDVGQAAGGLTPGVRVAGAAYTDPAKASDAAASLNSADAVQARQVAAYRKAGKPMEAQQLETAGVQGKAAKFSLDKAQSDFLNEQFDKKLSTITTPDQLAGVLSGSPMAGGKEVTIAKTADGKKFQLMVPGPDGSMVKMGEEIGSDPKDIVKAITTYSAGMKAQDKIGAMQHMMTFEEGQKQFIENKRLQEQQITESQRHNRASEGIAGAHLGIARDAQTLAREKYDADLKNDPTRNLPGAVKMSVGGIDKTLTGIDAAITKSQAEGSWDPKSNGAKDLLARQAQLTGQRNKLLKPYMEGAGGTDDYMDYGKKPAAPVTPAGKSIAAAPPGAVTLQPNGGYAPTNTAPTNTASAGLPPATRPAAPAAGPSADPVAAAVGAATGNASIDNIVGQRVPAFKEAAQVIRSAQAEVAAAAQTGDQAKVRMAMDKAAQAGAQLEALLKDMMPAQQQRVKQALGLM